MTTPTYPAYPPAPFPAPAPAPRLSNTLDVIATSLLITTHLAIVTATGFFSLFYAMASDPCSSSTACNLDNITGAYVLTDLVGFAVLLIASTIAVVAMCRSRIAFWVPLVGMAAHVGLVAMSFELLGNVVP